MGNSKTKEVKTTGGARTISKAMDLLGIKKPMGPRKYWAIADIRVRLRRGLPYRSLENIESTLNVGHEEIAGLLAISPRTIDRRKEKKRLAPDESDRLLRIARILAIAEEVFEDRENAREWLCEPNPVLNMEKPLSLLDTDIGTRQVDDLLMRIEHGIYS